MNSITAFILAAGLLLCAACEREDPAGPEEPVTTVSLKFMLEETAVTKAVPAVNETAVTDVSLFIYNCATGHLMDYAYIEEPDENMELGISSGGNYSIYAIANSGDLTRSPGITDSTGLKNLFWRLETPEDIVNASGAIPMSGRVTGMKIEDGSSVSITLTRMLSRFRIIADTSGLDGDITTFSIRKVMLKNINRNISYFTRGSRAASTDDVFTDGLSLEGKELESIFSSGVDFYLPENAQGDLLSSNLDESTHIPPDPFDKLCTFVEIHVDYRSPEHYSDSLVYRYYLHDGQRLDNFDILRNTMYTCRTRFTGSGINEESWRIDVSGMKDLVTAISVTPDTRTFKDKGEKFTYSASVEPASAENPKVTWSSDNEDVAVVSQDGTVTAVSDGTCRITATAVDGSGVSGSATAVVDTYKFPTSVTISPERAEMYAGDMLRLNAEVLPDNANDKGVTWVSSDTGIATVSDDGTVTGVSAGDVRIIVTTTANSLKDTAYISIKNKSFKLGEMPDIIYPGYNAPVEIPYTAVPSAVPTMNIKVNSGHESGASISENSITASNPGVKSGLIGSYTLEAAANGISDTHAFSVSAGTVSLPEQTGIQYPGHSAQLTLQELSPSDIGVTWTSSDPDVASVDEKGNITPKTPGTCRITATTDAGAYDWTDITVSLPEIIFDSHIDIYEGESITLQAGTQPQSDLGMEYTVISGEEYVQIQEGNILVGKKRSDGNPDAVIEVRFKDFPQISKRAEITVHSCLSGYLYNGNKVVNTQGHSSDGSNWNNVITYLRMKVDYAPHIRIQWSITDKDGKSCNECFRISERNGYHIISPQTSAANGTFYITGWDQTHTYSTETMEIQSYQMLEYEVGLSDWSLYASSGRNYYIVSMYSRWCSHSWGTASGDIRNAIMNLELITPLQSSRDFRKVGPVGSAVIYAQNLQTNVLRSNRGVISDLAQLNPKSWIRTGLEDGCGVTKGVNGTYLILTTDEHGSDSYLFIKQRNEEFFNSSSYMN